MVPVSPTNYFLPEAADRADLGAWSSILPTTARVLRTNLFGDSFVIDGIGGVHILERAACSAERIAASEQEFWRTVENDPQGWQLRPLADACRHAGKILADGQCYAFTRPPVLGGDYSVENVWVAPWREWFSFTADLFRQIKDLPEGATVTLKVVD
jgi:hypothetical protein